jgi:hypothetical protein
VRKVTVRELAVVTVGAVLGVLPAAVPAQLNGAF